MSPNSAWEATKHELKLQLPKATYNTWLQDSWLIAVDDDTYTIGVQSDYACEWLENRLHGTIIRVLSTAVGKSVDVVYTVAEQPQEQPQEKATPTKKTFKRAPSPIKANNLNSRYTFNTFVVGHNNRLAHAAALSIAEIPGQTYNPLFIYGGVGLGKTHLLHAIGNRCVDAEMTVLYVTSEQFTNDLILSIRSQKTEAFRQKYRTPDLLLIDDIQFIAGKESTQEELFHTFNDLHSRGTQLVLSSDRPPKAMVTLEERLKSRFEWGLMADIQLPDQETRLAILQNKAEELGVNLPRGTLQTIANHVRNNIRELEGALNKIVAYSQLTNRPITQETIDMALADLIRKKDSINIDQVIQHVAGYYNVPMDKICGRGRSRAIAYPRQIAMFLCRTETDASFPQIGAKLGGRDHTTIMHGHEKISTRIESDETLRRDVLEIKALLYET